MRFFSNTARPADGKKQVEMIKQLPAKPEPGSDQSTLHLHVHGLRVLVGTFAFASALAGITAVFFVGVEIMTLDSSQLSDDDRHQLLDHYNSYSGSIASVLSIPVQSFTAMVLPVFFLYFTTHAVLAKNKSIVMTWGPAIALGVVSYMIGLGLNSMNVQFNSPKLEFRIVASDLVGAQADTTNFTKLTYITSTTHVAGVPSTDTILRSAIVQSFENAETTCTDAQKKLLRKPEVSIEIGFPLNSWLDSMLPQSIASSKSFNFSMYDNFTERQVSSPDFPNGDVQQTAMLLAAGYTTMLAQFVSDSIVDLEPYLAPLLDEVFDSPDASSLLTNIQDTIGSNVLLESDTFWHYIDTSEITIELSSFNLSDQVSFEAVTFEIPVTMDAMSDLMSHAGYTNNASAYDDQSVLCSDLGCIVKTQNNAGTNQDQVRLVPLCAGESERDWVPDRLIYPGKCDAISNSSVLVLSIARQFATDDDDEGILDWFPSESTWGLRLNNPRIVFRVTVGRLSWSLKDLTTIYDGSVCAEGVNCRGLYFPLADGKRHVIVGEEYIPLPQNSTFTDPEQWQTLVMAKTQIDDSTRGDVIAYRFPAYRIEQWNTTTLSKTSCSTQATDFVSDFIERHIYSKDSVQPAYTAALFWLFHRAAVKQVLTANSSNSLHSVQLQFNGNRSWIGVQAVIPFASACVTFIGCGIFVITGLLIACRSRNQRGQDLLAKHIAPHNVSAVLADASQFPPFLVSVGVKQQTTDPIGRFEIVDTLITLFDQQDKSMRYIVFDNRSKQMPDEGTQIESSLVVDIKDTT